MHTTSETNILELIHSKVQISNFNFQKFQVVCDAMMHVLKNFYINLNVTPFNIDVILFRSNLNMTRLLALRDNFINTLRQSHKYPILLLSLLID